jgi:hypothetical protein
MIEKDLEAKGRGLIEDIIPTLAWSERRKPPKDSVRRVDVSAEIRTEYLQNTSQKLHYSLS